MWSLWPLVFLWVVAYTFMYTNIFSICSLKSVTHQFDSRPLTDVRPPVSVRCPSFAMCPAACWIDGGPWKRPGWLAFHLSQSVHEKHNRSDKSKQTTKLRGYTQKTLTQVLNVHASSVLSVIFGVRSSATFWPHIRGDATVFFMSTWLCLYSVSKKLGDSSL